MEKKLSDYLHLYVSAEPSFYTNNSVGQLNYYTLRDIIGDWKFYEKLDFKIALRLLSDMEDQDCIEVSNLLGWSHMDNAQKVHSGRQLFADMGYYNKVTNLSGRSWAKIINYLRSREYDCDHLIADGLAIDKNKIIKA